MEAREQWEEEAGSQCAFQGHPPEAESLAHNPRGHSDPNYSVLPSSVLTSFSLGFFGL